MSLLFEPLTIGDVTIKNRIGMAPMCMFSVEKEDGAITPFHITHYESRAIGGTGLVMLEATAVEPRGRILPSDLGIWSDEHIEGYKKVTERIHAHGATSAIQIGHAGRKAKTDEPAIAPSAFKEDHENTLPMEMTEDDIKHTIALFKAAAIRAVKSDFNIIELHGAHGYLINQFLSPLTNKRTDAYGGTKEKRYQFLREIIDVVKEVFSGPLFVRISADEYHDEGNQMSDFVYFSKEMKKQGVDLVHVSTGGVVNAPIDVFPGYQLRHAETIKKEANIMTGAVGLITDGKQAENILINEQADLIFIGRQLLRDPYWAKTASESLGVTIEAPIAYSRGW